MKFETDFKLDFDNQTNLYFDLLKEEDYEFKTKDILIDIKKNLNTLDVNIKCNSVLDMKIGLNAFIKSLEIIEKTLKV